jgi:hypothetical protein
MKAAFSDLFCVSKPVGLDKPSGPVFPSFGIHFILKLNSLKISSHFQ